MADKKRTDKEQNYDEAYNLAWPSFGAWQTEAKRDIRAYLGDIYTTQEKKKLKLRGSDILNIQLIRRLVLWTVGFQIDHRRGIRYDPIEGSDDAAASDLTELASYVMNHNGGYGVISKAFEHALKPGLSLVNIFNNQNFDTNLDHFFYNQFVLDPTFTRLDLSDCRYGIIRKFITKDQAKMLLPESKHSRIDKIDDERPKTASKFPNYITQLLHGKKLIAYDEFQEKTTREEIVIINRQTGDEQVWDGTRTQLNEQLPIILQVNGIPAEAVTTITRRKETVEVSAFLNGEEFNTELDPFGLDDFSFTPIWCYFDPEYDQFDVKLQGFVRGLREIQRAESMRIISMVAWFQNSIQNGLDFEEGTLVDMEDAFKTGMGPRMFKKGALAGDKVRDRVAPSFPAGNLELHQVLEDSMPKTIGMTPELMGTTPTGGREQISGFLNSLRIGQGMIGMRTLFDDLSTSQNIIGTKLRKLIQQYPTAKIRKILGREPSPRVLDKTFGKFDTKTSEAQLSDTQRNTEYQELIALKEMGARINEPFPATWVDIIKKAPTQQNDELLRNIEQREQQAQQQRQQQAALNNQMTQVTLQMLQSEMVDNQAQAEERRTEAVGNMAQAGLDRAKTVAEIQGVVQEAKSENINNLLNAAIEIEKLNIERSKLNQPLQKDGVS
jgi:hypothetical protein